jgi:hypothetical protein
MTVRLQSESLSAIVGTRSTVAARFDAYLPSRPNGHSLAV